MGRIGVCVVFPWKHVVLLLLQLALTEHMVVKVPVIDKGREQPDTPEPTAFALGSSALLN